MRKWLWLLPIAVLLLPAFVLFRGIAATQPNALETQVMLQAKHRGLCGKQGGEKSGTSYG